MTKANVARLELVCALAGPGPNLVKLRFFKNISRNMGAGCVESLKRVCRVRGAGGRQSSNLPSGRGWGSPFLESIKNCNEAAFKAFKGGLLAIDVRSLRETGVQAHIL